MQAGGCFRTKASPGKFRLSSPSLLCCRMYAARLLPRTCGGAGQFRFRQLSCKEPPAPCHKKSTKASGMCFVQDCSELSPIGRRYFSEKIPPRENHERPSSRQSVFPNGGMNACASCPSTKIKRKAPRRSPTVPKYRVHQHQTLTEPRLRIPKRHTFPVQAVFFNLSFKESRKSAPFSSSRQSPSARFFVVPCPCEASFLSCPEKNFFPSAGQLTFFPTFFFPPHQNENAAHYFAVWPFCQI